ncbi:MAG: hypothetical protein RBT37_00950 [Dissulfurispiraceae bacterium]|jgi:hypothetical protein|nr:hypothetical protein [Dissulfurispiraceae bacterium]
MGFFAFLGFLVLCFLMMLIFRKAGYSGIQLILIFIPFVNVLVIVWFAMAEWPIQRELRMLKVKDLSSAREV